MSRDPIPDSPAPNPPGTGVIGRDRRGFHDPVIRGAGSVVVLGLLFAVHAVLLHGLDAVDQPLGYVSTSIETSKLVRPLTIVSGTWLVGSLAVWGLGRLVRGRASLDQVLAVGGRALIPPIGGALVLDAVAALDVWPDLGFFAWWGSVAIGVGVLAVGFRRASGFGWVRAGLCVGIPLVAALVPAGFAVWMVLEPYAKGVLGT